MKIQISAREIAGFTGSKLRNYCIECKLFYSPVALEQDPHATHYNLILPGRREDFDSWVKRVRQRDEQVWGIVLDEHGTRCQAFCPSDFELEVTE